MRSMILLLTATAAISQVAPQTQYSKTTEDLRSVSAVSSQIVWASGTHGTYLRTTDGGRNWIPGQVPDAATLDFRGVVAFSADEAFLMSAGPGDQSRVYHTMDAGVHWQRQFTATNPKSFFDSIAFRDRIHGIVLGDPIANDSGTLKFELLMTDDGEVWKHVPSSQLPPALEGEGAFAASNTCVALLHSNAALVLNEPSEKDAAPAHDPNIWFATGGKVARVFHSRDGGHSWQVFETPIVHGPESAGIFSIAFRDPLHGVIAGGDYKHPEQGGANLASTKDGGKTWAVSKIFPQSYYSGAAYDLKLASTAKPMADDDQAQIRLFLANPNYLYDFRPPQDPTRISPPKKSGVHFNAISPFPTGGAILVGPKGSIATIP